MLVLHECNFTDLNEVILQLTWIYLLKQKLPKSGFSCKWETLQSYFNFLRAKHPELVSRNSDTICFSWEEQVEQEVKAGYQSSPGQIVWCIHTSSPFQLLNFFAFEQDKLPVRSSSSLSPTCFSNLYILSAQTLHRMWQNSDNFKGIYMHLNKGSPLPFSLTVIFS